MDRELYDKIIKTGIHIEYDNINYSKFLEINKITDKKLSNLILEYFSFKKEMYNNNFLHVPLKICSNNILKKIEEYIDD